MTNLLDHGKTGTRGSGGRASRLTTLVAAFAVLAAVQTASFAEPQVSAFRDGDAKSGRFVNLANKLQMLGSEEWETGRRYLPRNDD